ncbi:MAG TPA: class I SAM-dependent methyltransferase [Bryobacteraceae bacterium]|nr:class I SAM-dependent methyltransferase [Bryobacteraceae bacterium]
MSQAQSDYAIRGGREGRNRLELLGRILWPTTFQLLRRIGIHKGMVCLDLGCGGGDVTRGLARLAGREGRVVGIDMDAVKLDAAREEGRRQQLENVEFRQANVYEWTEELTYDRVYSRFLLTHLPDSLTALHAMRRALRPGGVLIVEDIDFTGSFSYPPCAAYERYLELYRSVVKRRGGDADIGPKLYSLLKLAGLQGVNMSLMQPFHVDQDEKALSLITLMNIMDALRSEELAEPAELERTIAGLKEFTDDPTTVLGLPRIFQAWGSRV